MLTRLATFTVRRRKVVLVAAAVTFAVSGALGGNVAQHLSTGGFENPNAESAKAGRALERTFRSGSPNLVLLVTAKSGTVDDPAAATAGAEITRRLAAEPFVEQALSYWTLNSAPPLRGKDGRQALVLARITGNQDQVDKRVRVIRPRFASDSGPLRVQVGGFAEVFDVIGAQIQSDLARAEAISLPLTLLLLVLVFGSVVAASLPLAVGGLAIVGTFLALRGIAALTEVSVFSLSLTTAMGLGLAIDYSLFVVSRFREEMRAGRPPHEAVVRSVQTAGRTVLFSAATVAISLAALLIFPLSFLRSFAYAGVAVVAIAAVGAVVVLPALLAVLGDRVDKLALFHRQPKPVGEGFWHRAAMLVMRRPLPVAAAVVVLLLFLGAPFLRIAFGLPDDRVLPPGSRGRAVSDQLRANNDSQDANSLPVVAVGTGDPRSREGDINAYAASLSRMGGVARVDALTGSYIGGVRVTAGPGPAYDRFVGTQDTWLSVVPNVEALSAEGERLVRDIRAAPGPFPVQVAGPSAQLVDAKKSLFGLVPWAAGFIALVTFTLLFLMFGSILVPVKAVVLNLLSLTATFGAMVWIFQDGHLSTLLHFTPTGAIDTTTPILMFCVAFGLSMDYEVFLLSRIKEEHDRTADNTASVAVGLERTGRIVTAAAALLAVVFIAFSTSEVSFIKLFGVGLTMAVLMDATLIRAALVPAFMRLAGQANWWAPAPLRRVYERFGFSEGGGGASPADVAAQAPVPAGPGRG